MRLRTIWQSLFIWGRPTHFDSVRAIRNQTIANNEALVYIANPNDSQPSLRVENRAILNDEIILSAQGYSTAGVVPIARMLIGPDIETGHPEVADRDIATPDCQ